MKKMTESNWGIWIIAIVPALIVNITFIKDLINMKSIIEDIKPHLPFILSMGTLILILSFLYIRKWILTKISALDKYHNNMHDDTKAISDLYDVVHRRQISHLVSILRKANLWTTPPKLLTDYEQKLEISDKLTTLFRNKVTSAFRSKLTTPFRCKLTTC